MNKIINKSAAIKTIIIIIGVGIVLTIFPLRLWPQTITSTIPRTSNETVGAVTIDENVEQQFVAEYGHMSKLRLYLAEGSTGHSFYLRMFDSEQRLMFEETVLIGPVPGFHEILVDQNLIVDDPYVYVIQAKTESGYLDIGESSRLYLGTEQISEDDYPFTGPLYFNGFIVEGRSLAVEYDYTIPWQDGYSWLLVAVLLLATFLTVTAIDLYYRKHPANNTLIVAAVAVQAVLNPLIILLVAVSLVSIVLQVHGEYLLDNIFFAVATLFFGGICWYGTNHNRDGQPPLVTKAIVRENWPDYLQVVFLALAFNACCDYVNALYSAQQKIGQNKQIIFFGLAVLAMMRRREIFRYVNLLYLTIAGGLAYYFYDEQIKAGMDELSKNDITIITLTTWVNLIGGFVALNVLFNVVNGIIKKEMKQISYVFGGLLLLFIALLVVFRNGRAWLVVLAVCFVVYALQCGVEKRGKVIYNICYGLILQFVWQVGYSLLFRPFATYRSIRFPMGFHTVTITAVYLAMVVAAALTVFMTKYRQSPTLKNIWKEGVLLGVALSYEFLTMSRTGYLAVIVVAAFSLLFLVPGKGKRRRANIVRATGWLGLSFLLCLPIVFYLQRTIPALVSDPSIYYIEDYFQETTRGRELSSFQYARVGRFIEVFAEGVLGSPDLVTDIYRINQIDEQLVITADGTIMSGDEARARGIEGAITVKEKLAELAELNAGEETTSFKEDVEGYLGYDPDTHYEKERDYSSGRIDIFKRYIAELNTTGHDTSGLVMPDGTSPYHAHNNYIQVAYDFGTFIGAFFIILGVVTFGQTIAYYRHNCGQNSCAAFPMLAVVVFAVIGITELAFHFSNPVSFALLLLVTPLIYRS
ncbi:MAG: hypothetical protein LBI54_02615 [Lachnospiraceae bacterium]|jgi:hypothetical protein|nr:hypothetical protein [Lachnospiraceae bacterium]